MFGVTRGEYSDYTLVCLFEDREDAEAFRVELDGVDGYNTPQIEEFPFYVKGTRPKRITVYCATFFEAGIQLWQQNSWDFENPTNEIKYWMERIAVTSLIGFDHAKQMIDEASRRIKNGELKPRIEVQWIS